MTVQLCNSYKTRNDFWKLFCDRISGHPGQHQSYHPHVGRRLQWW